MPHFAQALDLRDDPELIAQYKAHHRAVWPEVMRGLRAIGITKMRIYLVGTHLFMYYEAREGFDPARDYQSYAADPRTREWDLLMRTFQQPLHEAASGEWWTPMECVWELET